MRRNTLCGCYNLPRAVTRSPWRGRRWALERLEPRLALDVALGEGQVLFESDLVDPINVLTADLDADGRVDVVAQSRFDQSIVWFRNQGEDGFARPRIVGSPIERLPVRVADDDAGGDASLPELHAWDVDTDGDLDLVAAWWRDLEVEPLRVRAIGEVAWLENVDGTGEIWHKHVIDTAAFDFETSGKSYLRTARGDFNDDGRDDLAVLRTEVENASYPYALKAEVSWFAARSDGSGFEGEAHLDTFSFSPFLSNLAAADVDADGDVDLTLALQPFTNPSSEPPATETQLLWFESDSTAGGLQDAEVLLTSDDYFASTSFVDLDEDGDPDVLVEAWRDTHPYRVIGWHENVAGQIAADMQVITPIHDGYNRVPNSVAARGDIDGDGRQDLIVAGAGNNSVSGIGWYSHNAAADGLSLRAALPALTSTSAEWHFLETLDVDHDGDLDLAASYVETDYDTDKIETPLYWWENLNGEANFGLPQLLLRPEGEWDYSLVRHAAGDTVVGWSTSPLDTITLLTPLSPEGSPAPSWRVTSVLQSPGFEEAWLVKVIDASGERDFDLVGAAPALSWTQRLVYASNIRGGISDVYPLREPPKFFTSLQSVDMMGDGAAGLLYTTLHEVGWRRDFIEGGGTIFETEARVNAAAAGDVDQDGDQDVLVAITIANSNVEPAILLIENRGSTFGYNIDFAVPRIVAAAEARELHLADIDGDGDLDVYSENSVWLNTDGRGTLELLLSFNHASALTIAAADFDGDGDLDLLRRAYGPLYLAEYDQQSGAFLPPRMLPWPADATREAGFAPVDLDSDGDLDIVGVTRQGYWLENTDGAGSFAPADSLGIHFPSRVLSVSRSGPPTVQPVDWDADGDSDLIVTGWADGQTKVLLYVNQTTVPQPASGDFDANGYVSQSDLDLVLTNWGRDGSDVPQGWTSDRPSGFVDQNELDAVLRNWGSQSAAARDRPPEPTVPAEATAKPRAAARSKLRDIRDDAARAALFTALQRHNVDTIQRLPMVGKRR